jgi:hypothetical protein
LRWLTRLENALKNPATRKKIEFLCGSIEDFLKNPSMLNSLQGDPNFTWMRAVTPEEAQNCLTRMSFWASTSSKPSKFKTRTTSKNSFDERVFKPLQKWEVGLGREPGLDLTLTPWCAQYMWESNRYFPSCPKAFEIDPLGDYFQNLTVGAVLSYGDHDLDSTKLEVVQSLILRETASILVMCEGLDHRLSIVGIELHEKSRHFIHFLLGSYSTKSEADGAFLVKKELKDFWSAAYTYAWKRI